MVYPLAFNLSVYLLYNRIYTMSFRSGLRESIGLGLVLSLLALLVFVDQVVFFSNFLIRNVKV